MPPISSLILETTGSATQRSRRELRQGESGWRMEISWVTFFGGGKRRGFFPGREMTMGRRSKGVRFFGGIQPK